MESWRVYLSIASSRTVIKERRSTSPLADRRLRSRLGCVVLLLALSVTCGLIHLEDLAVGVMGKAHAAPSAHTVSRHSPRSSQTHWHLGMEVKEDPCLACQSQRMAGPLPDLAAEVALLLGGMALSGVSGEQIAIGVRSSASRAPPSSKTAG
jgi:hypothetical protein